jgi:hypothetical protein
MIVGGIYVLFLSFQLRQFYFNFKKSDYDTAAHFVQVLHNIITSTTALLSFWVKEKLK